MIKKKRAIKKWKLNLEKKILREKIKRKQNKKRIKKQQQREWVAYLI
jgi:hypothetical protein